MASKKSAVAKSMRLHPDIWKKVAEIAAKYDISDSDAAKLAIVKYWEAEFPERRK